MSSSVFHIARKDLAYTLRERNTLVWLLFMPLVFFYFIGTMTAGFSAGAGPQRIAVVVPDKAGFLVERILTQLKSNELIPIRFHPDTTPFEPGDKRLRDYSRQLRIPAGLTASIVAGRPVHLEFTTTRKSLSGDYDVFRLKRAVYTVLADIIVSAKDQGHITASALAEIDAAPRSLTLSVESAGARQDIPVGMQQAVPGILVMFTLMMSFTSGGIALFLERKRGTLRRLASAPISRTQLVTGKWLGKLALNGAQITFAMLAGWLLFDVHWGPDLPMLLAVLLAWAGFCAGLGMLLGSVARSEGQVTGFGVLAANLLAALGGCWWPIEITPAWMQSLQKLLPTGWIMNAMHQLVNFQNGASAAIGDLATLLLAALFVTWLAKRKFSYQ